MCSREMRALFCRCELRRCVLLFAVTTLILCLVPALHAQVCCTHPLSETSHATGPHGGAYVAEDFMATVADPTGDNFNGRIVTESDYKTGYDSCWFAGNTIAMQPTALVNGDSWIVGSTNQYGPDAVGWTVAAVQYIRTNSPAHGIPLPCTTQVYQLMSMACSGGTASSYSANVLSETIYINVEVSCRQGVCVTLNE